ncbi:restriction endonuclease subunit S [Lacticaseibacillus paracasei]|uniref:restriction endonuclease subunit S n=1 Tax=Lacticaseibacillus paracasei TaxID=1597 RepID=UPI0035E3E4B4
MGQSPDSKNYTLNPQDHILVQGNADIKNGWVEPRVWTTQITKIAKKGSVLLSVRAPVGEVSKTAFDVVLGRGVASVGQTDFLYQYLITLKINGFWLRYSTGSTFDSINSADIKDAIIFLPEKNEQSRIAKTLNCIDNLIAATQHSIDALEQAKKALLQRLFDQSWRFKGYSDPWEKRKLGEVVERVTRKNRDLVSTRPLTISAQDGLVDQRKFFSKTVASKNISNYFLLKAGDFAYNKSYSVGYPWGAVKRLDKYPSGVLSTLYIVFKPKKINSQFLVTYFEGTTWYVSVSKVASEGARNHGLLNISASDFFDQQLFFPTKKTEQESIGLTIKVLDDLIAATQSRLSSLELLKKALLQDLFI